MVTQHATTAQEFGSTKRNGLVTRAGPMRCFPMFAGFRARPWLLTVAVCLAVGIGGLVLAQRPQPKLGAQPDGGVLVPSNQTVTPIGTVRRTEGVRPKDVALSPDGETLAVLTTGR